VVQESNIPEATVFTPPSDASYADIDAKACARITGEKPVVLTTQQKLDGAGLPGPRPLHPPKAPEDMVKAALAAAHRCVSSASRTSSTIPSILDYHEAYKNVRNTVSLVADIRKMLDLCVW
jgi:hypothetical protein